MTDTPPDFDQLIADLSSPDVETRRRALNGFAGNSDPRVIEAVLAHLAHEDDYFVCGIGLRYLFDLEVGMPTIEPLLRYLVADDNPSILSAAAGVLVARSDDPRAVALVAPLLQHEHYDVRAGIAHALKERNDPKAIPYLTAALNDTDDRVRQFATEALAQIDAQILAYLRAPDVETRRLALHGIDEAVPRLVEPIVAHLAHEDDPHLIIQLLMALFRAAIEAKAKVADIGPLQRFLDPDANDSFYTYGAGLVIALSDDPRAVALVASLLHHWHTDVQTGIAQMLHHRNDPATIPYFLPALTDADGRVRETAAAALAQFDADAVQRHLDLLTDDPAQRLLALEIMARQGQAAVLDELVALLQTAPDVATRLRVVDALRRLGRGTIALRQATYDPDPEVRWKATEALVRRNDKRAVPSLLRLLASADDARRRTNIITELAGTEDERAVIPLIEAAVSDDPAARSAAALGFMLLAPHRYPDALQAALDHPDPRVHAWATAALAASHSLLGVMMQQLGEAFHADE